MEDSDKHLKVSGDLHRRLKAHADKNGQRLQFLVEQLLEKALKDAKDQAHHFDPGGVLQTGKRGS